MPEPRSHSLDCPERRKVASGHGEDTSGGERVPGNKPVPPPLPARAADSSKNSASIRQPEAILAGLPAPVMDELVEDMAEAVVAMLLDKEVLGPDDDDSDDARSNLRQI